MFAFVTEPFCTLRRRFWSGVIALLLAGFATTSQGIILFSTGDPTTNTTAPTGALAGSGWQYQGTFGSFLGTAVGPHHFLTAKHIGIASGTFIYQGVSYEITRWYDDPMADLRLFEVAGTLPNYAPLYPRSDEAGQRFVVIGRGTQRGDAIYSGGIANGWTWGASDGVQRWGENTVVRAGYARLYATFDQNGGSNEADLSSGDSGGAVFINDDGVWKLAGINSEVDGPFATTSGGATFVAAIFDCRGLYNPSGLYTSGSSPVSMGFYAARISYRLNWLMGILHPAVTDFSARGFVDANNTVTVHFAISGGSSMNVLVRGLGPSLTDNNLPIPGSLTNPTIEIHDSTGAIVASDDNWTTTRTGRGRARKKNRGTASTTTTAIQATGMAPANSNEAALLATLTPGSYTAILRGVKKASGVGQLDIIDLDNGVNATLVHLGADGLAGAGAQAWTVGLTAQANSGQLFVRVIGPELRAAGVTSALDDPTVEIYDGSGNLIATNDNWQDAPNRSQIEGTGLAPADARESAVLLPVSSQPYTAVVRGVNGTTGQCRVEAYYLP